MPVHEFTQNGVVNEFLISQAVVYKNTPYSLVTASDQLNDCQGKLMDVN